MPKLNEPDRSLLQLERAVCDAHAPLFEGDFWDWSEQHSTLPHSVRTTAVDRQTAPQLIKPALAIASRQWREQTVVKPVQGGGSTILDLLVQWIPVNAPGLTWLNVQKKEAADELAEQRILPQLKSNPETARLLPMNRYKIRKNEIVFAHMPLKVQAANRNNLQSKSVPWVLNDEVWLWKEIGLLEQARKRIEAVWNGQVVNISQGSIEDDQLFTAFSAGRKNEWGFTCPKCNKFQLWKWSPPRDPEGHYGPGGIKWDRTKKREGEYILDDVVRTIYAECDGCLHRFENTLASRRAMTDSGDYLPTNEHPDPKKDSWRYPAMSVYWIDWATLLTEWIAANDAETRGNIELRKLFIQQRLADFWQERQEANNIELVASEYTKADYLDGQLWEGEMYRFFTVDVQQHHFWGAIRAWRPDATSRLIWEGKINTYDTIRDLQERYKVQTHFVFIDARWFGAEVFRNCTRWQTMDANRRITCWGWTGLMGEDRPGYTHHPVGRKPLRKNFSAFQYGVTEEGRKYRYALFSNEKNKDILANLRNGRGAKWEIPRDVSGDYLQQIDGEVKRQTVNKVDNSLVWRWVQIKPKYPNHAWDLEVQQIVAASMFNLLKSDLEVTESAETQQITRPRRSPLVSHWRR